MSTPDRIPAMFSIGQHVETLITPPHPAAFAGVVIDVGTAVGGASVVLVREPVHGIEQAFTPRSLRAV